MTVNDITKDYEASRKILSNKGMVWRIRHSVDYFWKRIWLVLGSETPSIDDRTFAHLRTLTDPDLHFIFCSGHDLGTEIHERMTVVYGKPIVPLFISAKWGNLGFSLPCDVKLTKYGTLGGPIAPLVRIDPQSQNLIARIGDTEVTLDEYLGKWDEEGSLIVFS
jgi:hypothetical protein